MIIERDDGTLCLPTRGDPAYERAIGYRKFWLGVDLGQVNDPTAFVIIRDERIPFWEGRRQALGERQRAIVWADFVKDTSYSAISDYIRRIMMRPAIVGRVKLAVDATGVGRAFSDFLIEKQIEHVAVTITAGQATTRKGRYHNVAKNVLLGDLATGLETQKVIVAHDLPLRDRFMQELESFEVKTTAAGNTVLDTRATEHHADLAIAAAIALHLSNNAPGYTGEGKLVGWY